ncbi:transcriptional regulator SplA domain-containing protein [Fredinandcohnia sp. 179-A 10B2 NHS]|uniref:transcriptional regulator SplA domain-containing protein n=1 Tax=Fredinandcohnia sp. 179-A 10B2 NHS TaxID=3235176 RepID=UPI0039A3B81F
MNIEQENSSYKPGDIVYVFYRNPHTQDVANVQEAAVVSSPDNPNELALFLYDTYYPLTNELAVYSSEESAQEAYQQYFEGY